MKRTKLFIVVCSSVLIGFSELQAAEVEQEVEVTVQQKDVNSPESKFEEYEEIPNGLTIDDYYLKSTGEDVNLDIEIRDLRLDQQSAKFKLQGNRGTLNGSWDQVPHLYSNEAKTLYIDNGNGELRLPDQLQSDIQSSPLSSTTTGFVQLMNGFITGAHLVELKTRTDTGKMDLNYELSDQLRAEIGFSKQARHGYRAKGADFGFNNDIEVALPVDEDTYNSNLGFNYLGKTVQAGFLYNLSSFQNQIDNLVWDNPKRFSDRYTSASGYSTGDQSSQGRMSLAPDNLAHNVLLSAGANLPHRTRFTANIGFNHHAQNESLLPYTINSAMNTSTALTGTAKPPFDASDPANRPADKASAKIVTWTQNYDLTTNWNKKFKSKLKFNSIQTDNKTPELTMPGMAKLDQVWTVGNVENHAFESRKDGVEGRVDYDVCSGFATSASFGETWTKRMHREVHDQKEDTLKLGVEVKPLKNTTVRGGYQNAKREMDEFDTAEQVGTGEIPGLRRFDIADRTRNEGNLGVQTQLGKFSVGVNGKLGHDKFEPGKGDLTGGVAGNANQMYGVQDVRNAGAGLDMDVDLDRVGFFIFYNYEQAITNQRSAQNSTSVALQVATASWVVRNNDRYDSLGVGMDIYAIKNLVDLKLGIDINRSFGTTNITDKGNLAKTSPPETRTTKQDYYINGIVNVNPTFKVTLAYTFEKYDISDFANEDLSLIEGATAGQSTILLGDSVRDYRAHVYSVGVQYKFGS